MIFNPRFPTLAFGAAVVWSAFAATAAPAPDLTVSQWADKYRYISAESGARFPGRWRTDRVSYTREVMDAMGVDHPARRVFFRAGAQVGKTQCSNNAMGHCIDTQPRGIILVAPSGDKALAFNREQFQPMVDATEVLSLAILPTRGKSEEGSTNTFKRFRSRGGYLKIVSAQTENALQSSTAGLAVLEEVASFPQDTGGRGHAIEQIRKRLFTWGDEAKEIGTSTTHEIGNCRSTDEFEAGDQRRYYTPCGQCGDYSELVFEAMRAGNTREDGTTETPHFVQPCCGGVVERVDLSAMLVEHPLATSPPAEWPDNWRAFSGGIWIRTYRATRESNPQTPAVIPADELRHWRARPADGRHVSFHIWQGQSPFSNWSDIWAEWQSTKADPDKLVAFYQQVLALPYEPAMDRPKLEQIVEAIALPAYNKIAQLRRGEIPAWASMLAGAIDTQIDRLDCATWAFGPAEYGEASPGRPAINAALIDWHTIEEVPESAKAWAAASAYRNKVWPGARTVDLSHDKFGVDTGGAHTSHVYSAVARDVGLIALKGSNKQEAMPIAAANNRVKVKGGRQRSIPLFHVGGHNLKKRVYYGINQGLASIETGRREPGAIFFPPETPEWIIKQMTIEYLIPVTQGRNRTFVWDKPRGAPNEHLDLAVYSFAVATMFGLDRMDRDAWTAIAEQRYRPDIEDAPMDVLWAGNGHAAPETTAQEVVKQVHNPGTKKGTPDWVKTYREANRGKSGGAKV